MTVAAALLAGAALLTGPGETVPPVMCPAALDSHAFERISIFNIDSAGKEYELAPDSDRKPGNIVEQTWHLSGYRTMALLLRCRYRGTEKIVPITLPSRLQTCTFRYRAARDGGVMARPEMSCR